MKKNSLFLTFILFCIISFSQNQSIHQEQNEIFSQYNFTSEQQWDTFNNFVSVNNSPKTNSTKNLTKEIMGWNPYWMGTSYYDFNYNLLSEVSYFSYEVNPNTGNYDDIHYWKTTELLDYAHASGTRVSLTATLFDDHEIFFANPESVQTLIDSLISLVQLRDADGVNIDFESVPSSESENLTNFMISLSQQFHDAIPGSTVSIALPAVDWGNKFDVEAMNEYVDIFIIMGYEYYWSGSSNAGPGSPLSSGDIWYGYNTTTSILDYLNRGASPEKLYLGLPYYSRNYATASNSIPSENTGTGSAVIYKTIIEEYSDYDKIWDDNSQTSCYIYETAGSWNQCWHNGEDELFEKCNSVNVLDIGGVGIWALGYDGSYNALNNVYIETLTTDGNNLCTGTFYDLGGPNGNYYDDENYTYTIAPKNAETIKILFDYIDIETDYDTLYIYDGADTNSTLLTYYSGEYNDIDTLETTTGVVTFKFISDHATTYEGWKAMWTCDIFAQTQQISNEIDIKIFPNPTNSFVQVEANNLQIENIQVYDLSGKVLEINQNPSTLSTINVSDYSNGIYFIKITTQSKVFIRKIIKN